MKKFILLLFLLFVIVSSYTKAQGLKNAVVLFDAGNRYISSMRTDVFQNSYFSMTNGANDTSFVQKRDSSGNLLWEVIWNSPFYVQRVVADHLGNVYVSGHAGGSFDLDPGPGISTSALPNVVVVICLDATGGFLWGRTTQDISGLVGACNLIDVDVHPGGGVVVYGGWSGSVDLDPSSTTFQPQQFLSWSDRTFLIRLDAAGNTTSLNTVETDCCNQYEVKCAPNGNYAAGFTANDTLIIYSQGTYIHVSYTSSNQNYCVVEFDQVGSLVWKSDLYNTGFSINQVINYDPQNNLYISAESYDTDLDPGAGVDTSTGNIGGDLFLIKLDTLRNREWIKMISSGFAYNSTIGLEINLKGEVFLSGTGTNNGFNRIGGVVTPAYSPSASPVLITLQPPTAMYSYLLKLNTCGEKEWERYWSDIGTDLNSYFSGFALNETDEIYYCGFIDNISDLDPDTSASLYATSSLVNENLVWLHLGKSEHCKPRTYNGTNQSTNTFINSVFLDTLQHPVAGYAGIDAYNEDTTLSTTLYPGESYHLQVIAGPDSIATTAAWIDYNMDLTFDTSEKIGNYTSVVPFDTSDFYFTVPITAAIGEVRLRVRNVCCESIIEPCCYYNVGQTNDYFITIGEGLLDLSALRVETPLYNICPDTIQPAVTFKNTGNLQINSFTANLEINGIIVSSGSSNQILNEEDSITLQFPSYYFSSGSTYTIRSWISNVNNVTDEEAGNDTISKAVQVFTLPVGSISGDTMYCPGIDVQLTASYSGGATYTWNNGSITSAFEIIQPDAGPYLAIVTVTDTNACSVTDSVYLEVLTAIIGSVLGDQEVCSNDTLTLVADYPSAISFSWQSGLVNNDTLSVVGLTAGLTPFNVEVTDSNGCIVTDSILVNILPVMPFTVLIPGSPCENDTISIQMQLSSGSTVNWCDGSSDTILFLTAVLPNVSTCYTVIDSNGCVVQDSVNLTVLPSPPIPVIQVIYQGSNNYLVVPVAGSGIIYAWYENAVLVQAGPSDTLAIPNLSSTYIVEVTNLDGCKSSSGAVLFTGLNDPSDLSIQYMVYPNPFDEEITLDFPLLGKATTMQIRVIDPTGRIVLPVQSVSGGTSKVRMTTSTLSSGLYVLVVSDGESMRVVRLIKESKGF